ncbi:MAG: aspartate 1-decarboxylase [Actinomycetota bacterium]|nr:aspartate 1-decarboxylase [Actinomycetota bacterium]MCL6092253.1 aspartate 1-decarboxylase [Actinomycetota bacterium]MDA8167590.1 aspartate 1-decarboxylase [Actinomycetota bacterium]
MRRMMLKSKIHRATVTGASIDYEGSISIDAGLMAAADILPHEQVHVLDIDSGARLTTYAITGGPGEICVNGAAARLVEVGDRVIILTYAELTEAELKDFPPLIVRVDEHNAAVAPAAAASRHPKGD